MNWRSPWFVLVAFLAASPGSATETLVLGILASQPGAAGEQQYRELAEYLGGQLPGHQVEIRTLNRGQLNEAIRLHQLDLLLTNPPHYVLLRQYHALVGAVATVVRRHHDQTVSLLGGTVIALPSRNDLGVLGDLADQRIAVPNVESFGGFQTILGELAVSGISAPERFARFVEVGDHESVVHAVLAGSVDAGFVRSGVLENMQATGAIPTDGLRVVGQQNLPGYPFLVSTRLYPEWPVVALPHLGEQLLKRISIALLTLQPEHPAARAAGIEGFKVASDYEAADDLLRRLRLPPYDYVPRVTLEDLWQQQRTLLTAGAAAAILVLSLLVLAWIQNLRLREQRRRTEDSVTLLRKTTAQIPGVVYQFQLLPTGSMQFLYLSEGSRQLLGLDAESVVHDIERATVLIHSEDQARFFESVRASALTLSEWDEELRLVTPHRGLIWIQARAKPERLADGATVWHGYMADVTQRRATQDALRRAAMVFENTRDGVIITDAAARILAVNQSFTRITGFSEAEALGQTPKLLQSDRQGPAFYAAMWQQLATTGHWQGEIWNRRRNGEVYPEILTIDAVPGSGERTAYYVGVFTDVSELRASQDRLAYLAEHDALTGLGNRAALEGRLGTVLDRIADHGGHAAVLLIDIDGFKHVNDSLGLTQGDRLLVLVSERLLNRARKDDTLARTGGDEFAILMEWVDRPEDAAARARDTLELLRTPFVLDAKQEVFVSASIGICLCPEDGTDPGALLRNVDAAMFKAKELGRDTFHFYTEALTRTAYERLSLETRLRRALQQGEFELHYQPQIRVRDGRVVAVEALLRWRDPLEGLIAPNDFIPVAEETGMIAALGDWVLRTACSQMRQWLNAGLGLKSVAVNLSSRQFLLQDVPGAVADALKHSGLPGRHLGLELTESTLMQRGEEAADVLKALKALGVELAIDDFGTGYSSFAYLRRFPVDTLKIDQSFVRDIPGDPGAAEITRAIIALGRNLGLKVVAEGVETPAQLDFLTRQGCACYQGYLASAPLPADALVDWLQHRPGRRAAGESP